MSKKINQILSAFFIAVILLTVTPVGKKIKASAANEKTVTAQFIKDNNGNYMETLEETFSCTARTATSATIKITCKYTINAHKYDLHQYDFEVKCANVTTGRKTIVPANTWKNNDQQASKPQSKTASTTLTIPVKSTNETTVNLECIEYQCSSDGKGTILLKETKKPGIVTYTIPKYNAPITSYTLTYNANGGSGAPSAQTGATTYTISSTKPTKSGYTFLGWSKSSTATSSEYAPGASITLTANTTLYAVWKKNATENIYNLKDETYSFKNFKDCELKKNCFGYTGGGHCYGMSVTSAAYYNGILSKTSVGATSTATTYSLSNNEKVRKPICYYQNKQYNSTIVAGGRIYKSSTANVSEDWNEVVNYVKNHNYDGKGNLIVSIKNGNNSRVGHAVNFLRYEEVNGQSRIYIYDNQYPDTEMYLYHNGKTGQDAKIYEYDCSGKGRYTFSYSNCIALRSLDKCIKKAGDFDGTHVIYAKDGAIEVEGAIANPMDSGDDISCVLYEIPSNYCEVIITPLVDNAEFTYLDEEYSFGEVGYDTYGVFTLATNNDNAGENEATFTIENEPLKVRDVTIKDFSIIYKSSYEIVPEIIADENAVNKVEYISSDTDIAIVDNSGNVIGKKTGSATITCTVTDKCGNSTSDTCEVTVSYAWWQWIIIIIFFGWIWY